MDIEIHDFVAGAQAARGVAVVIDVFRAFSVACYAFAQGASRIIPIADFEEALRLKRAHPEFLAIGERHARKLAGFDFGNSPTELERADLKGRTLVHTTHAGTQGLVNASKAEVVLTGSLVNAGAICAFIQRLAPPRVSLVRMGHEGLGRCEEDDLCAELLSARLRGKRFDTGPVRKRLRSATSARKFFDPAAHWAPERDFELCTDVDRFDFVLQLVTAPSISATAQSTDRTSRENADRAATGGADTAAAAGETAGLPQLRMLRGT
jgi:2-phosphosulfolactate phosphatase